MNTIQDLERLVAAIEKQGANVAPTYQEYMPLAFAIANDCGEAGRSLFHRICRISEKYVSDEADRLFDHWPVPPGATPGNSPKLANLQTCSPLILSHTPAHMRRTLICPSSETMIGPFS